MGLASTQKIWMIELVLAIPQLFKTGSLTVSLMVQILVKYKVNV